MSENVQALTFEKSERFLVAMRHSDRKFLFLEEDSGFQHTTTPRYVDNPLDATKLRNLHYSSESKWVWDDSPIREPSYYFENSDRMRSWLQDCVMVVVTINSVAII